MSIINADALDIAKEVETACKALGFREKSAFEVFVTGWLTGAIAKAPTIDAVPVVRCKDCIWFKPKHILHNDGTVTYTAEDADFVTIDIGVNCQATCRRHNHIDNLFVSDSGNSYCSYGEKMEDVNA